MQHLVFKAYLSKKYSSEESTQAARYLGNQRYMPKLLLPIEPIFPGKYVDCQQLAVACMRSNHSQRYLFESVTTDENENRGTQRIEKKTATIVIGQTKTALSIFKTYRLAYR